MKRIVAAIAVLGAMIFVDSVLAAEKSIEPPADRVVVMYFHRTQRCPTCRKMGSYTEEAMQKGFAEELKNGKVEFHFIDFQDEKNAALAQGYEVAGPTLVVAKVVDNKIKEQNKLTEMWTKVRDKDEFVTYVQTNVTDYMKTK